MSAPTHASFFSGVGGLDLGLERSGWRTVSFSEIDPYACAVLAERWPGVPNLGSISELAWDRRSVGRGDAEREWTGADLWTGGFPCQDLSVAGKRRGMGTHDDRLDTRSGLAYAFLDLVERYGPPAVLLENVPGLLSSHGGRDMAALLGRLVELGYGVAYRVLDARHFGVPQRRRRVFILGLRSGADDADGHLAALRAAAVLSVGTRCERHPATGQPKGTNAADGVAAGIARSLSTSNQRIDSETESFIVGSPADARGDGAPDGLAGRLDPGAGVADAGSEVAATQRGFGHGWQGQHMSTNAVFAPTLTAPDTRHRVENGKRQDGSRLDRIPTVLAQSLPTQRVGTDDNDAQGNLMTVGAVGADDPLLPVGLDSHRYRCCGNGVVAPVAEWLGRRILSALALEVAA